MMAKLPASKASRVPTDGDLSALEQEERAARDMLLRHERRSILEAAAENVLAFDEAVYDLRRERIITAAHLKAGELKLLVLRQVLQLRDRRLDHEETLAEVQKATEELRRNLNQQVTRQRQIDKDLKQTAREIKAAQADKQAQLNKLDVVIALKLNQLYCMDNAMESQEARSGGVASDENDKPRRKGGHIYAPAAPEAQQQQIRPAPAAGNQIEDARANQNGEEDTPPTEPPAGGLRGDSISEGRGDTSRLQSDAHNSEGNQDDGHQEEMKPKDQQQRRSEASEEGSMLVDMQAQ